MPTSKLSPLFSSVRSNKRTCNSLCLQTLLKSGFTPTPKHLNLHLLFLSQSQRFNSIVHFFSQMERNHIEGNSRTCSFFIQALLKLQKFEEAEQFIKTHVAKFPTFPPNGVWDSLIEGYCLHHKDPEKGLSVLRDCLSRYDTVPSSYTVCSLIHSFSSRGMMERAIEVLELMTGEKIKYPFCNFVCSSVIIGFVRIGKPELGVEFFEKAKISGALSPNVITYTSLVHALCTLGRVDQVSDLVRSMEEEGLAFDVVFYSCWICGYLEEGLLVEGFRTNRQMLEKAISADVVSYTSLMYGFSREVNVEKAVGFLVKMKRDGLEPNLITYTAVILGLCRKGKLEEAFTTFRMIEEMGIRVDEFLYATLMDGACGKGDFTRVLHLLSDMEKKGISPGVVTYNTVINGLCKFGRTIEADEFSKGVPRDIITYSTLLHGYIMEENVEGVLETRWRFEETGLSMDVVMCNVLIKASFMVGRFEEAHALYKRMPGINVTANSFTYCTLIDGYCKVGRIVEALEIFDEFKKTPISSVACYNCIISGLCRKGIVDMAANVFLELSQNDLPTDKGIYMMLIKTAFKNQGAEGVLQLVVKIRKLPPGIYDDVCNEALCFLCEKGFPDSAMEIYMLLRSNSSIITSESYFFMLKGLTNGNKHVIQPLLCLFVKRYGVADPKVGRSLAHCLCHKDVNIALRFVYKMKAENFTITLPRSIFKTLLIDGRALDAYKLLMDAYDVVRNMDVVDYTIILNGLCKGGYLDQALSLCSSLRKKGITLNIVSYNSIINALGRQGRLMEAFRLYDSLERVGLVPSEITYGTLIDTLCREQLLPEAELFLKKMIVNGHKPGIHVYNSFIDCYAKNDKLDEALKVLNEAEMKGLSVDEFTVSALLNGFCQRGDLEGALNLFSNFKDKGILPDLLGFLYLIRGLSAKGRMEEARSILREMLQCRPIVELIDKVESEVGAESLHNFLVLLCEQGNVKAAISVLDEIGSMYHPVSTFHGFHESLKTSKGHERETFHMDILRSKIPFDRSAPSIGSSEVKNMEISYNGKKPKIYDFDSFYSQVALLCSRGELEKANLLLKEMIC